MELVVIEDLLADGLRIITEGCRLNESLQHKKTHKPFQTCAYKHNQLIYSLLERRLILNAVTYGQTWSKQQIKVLSWVS